MRMQIVAKQAQTEKATESENTAMRERTKKKCNVTTDDHDNDGRQVQTKLRIALIFFTHARSYMKKVFMLGNRDSLTG